MMNFKNRIGGSKANRNGKHFEAILESIAKKDGYHCYKHPDGCASAGYNNLRRVKTGFDFIFIKSRHQTVFIDAKSTNQKRFAHSKITDHQLKELKKIYDRGVEAGYCVIFILSGAIVYFSAKVLASVEKNGSLATSDGVLLGTKLGFSLDGIFA